MLTGSNPLQAFVLIQHSVLARTLGTQLIRYACPVRWIEGLDVLFAMTTIRQLWVGGHGVKGFIDYNRYKDTLFTSAEQVEEPTKRERELEK
jgi:hypothetical protein